MSGGDIEMIFFAPLLVLIGALLSRRAKVYVLVPTTVLVWVAAAHFAHADALSFGQSLAAVFLSGACLQLGYLAGASLFHQRMEAQRKRAVVVVRR
jgi:hypothetical protein